MTSQFPPSSSPPDNLPSSRISSPVDSAFPSVILTCFSFLHTLCVSLTYKNCFSRQKHLRDLWVCEAGGNRCCRAILACSAQEVQQSSSGAGRSVTTQWCIQQKGICKERNRYCPSGGLVEWLYKNPLRLRNRSSPPCRRSLMQALVEPKTAGISVRGPRALFPCCWCQWAICTNAATGCSCQDKCQRGPPRPSSQWCLYIPDFESPLLLTFCTTLL